MTRYLSIRTLLGTLLAASMLCIAASASTALASYDFSYSGRLVDKDGKPLTGPVALKISFFHAETTTTSVLDVTQGIDNVVLKDGVFQVVLSLEGSDFQRVFPTVTQAVYIEVTDLTNAATTPYGRQRLTILPYAGKVPVDTSQFAWSSDGRLQLAVSGGADSTAVATLSNKTIDAGTNTITNISNSSISATAAIADSKLATISTAGKVSGAAITSGTIGGTTAVSTSGSIATTGKVGVGAAAGTSQMEVKGGGATGATSSLNVMDSAGSSKLFVRDDGNVGIGTTSPSASLDVNGGIVSNGYVRVDNGSTPVGSFGTGNTTNATFARNVFQTGGLWQRMDVTQYSVINQLFGNGSTAEFNVYTSDPAANPVSNWVKQFFVRNDGVSSFTGNVGIGTTNPSYKLDVVGTGVVGRFSTTTDTSDAMYVQSSLATGFSSIGFLNNSGAQVGSFGYANASAGGSLTDSVFFNANNKSMKFSVNGGNTSHLTLLSTGNVGIGTTSPADKLHVAGSLRVAGDSLKIFDTTGSRALTAAVTTDGRANLNTSSAIYGLTVNGDYTSGGAGHRFQIGGTDLLVMQPTQSYFTGNVGIGTTSPQAKLHVEGGAICVSSGAGSDDCNTAANTAGTIFAVNTTVQGADYAEYFATDDTLNPGDFVGLNSKSGLVRRYIAGDKLIGVASTQPGVVGNSKMKGENSVLVALVGQVPFNRQAALIDGDVVMTPDRVQVGYILSSGDLYLQISSADTKLEALKLEKDREIALLKSAICETRPEATICVE